MFIPAQRPTKTALRAYDRSVFHVKHRTAWRAHDLLGSLPVRTSTAGKETFPSGTIVRFQDTPVSRPSSRPAARRSESLQLAIAARRLDCGPHLWVTKPVHHEARLSLRAVVSRAASIVVRRCAFFKQSSAPREHILRPRTQLVPRSRAVKRESGRSLGEAGDLRHPSIAGGVGSVLRVIPEAHEECSHAARPEHRDVADTCSVPQARRSPVKPRSRSVPDRRADSI